MARAVIYDGIFSASHTHRIRSGVILIAAPLWLSAPATAGCANPFAHRNTAPFDLKDLQKISH
jgi:hypothetical protein